MLEECYCNSHDEKDSLGLGTLKTTSKKRINTSCVSQMQMFQLFNDENNVFRSMNKSKSTKDFKTFYEYIRTYINLLLAMRDHPFVFCIREKPNI